MEVTIGIPKKALEKLINDSKIFKNSTSPMIYLISSNFYEYIVEINDKHYKWNEDEPRWIPVERTREGTWSYLE